MLKKSDELILLDKNTPIHAENFDINNINRNIAINQYYDGTYQIIPF